MPTDIKIIHARDFIRATPDGGFDFETAKKLLIEIGLTAEPLPNHDIILDLRKAEPLLSVTEIWILATELRNLLKSFNGRTAVLLAPGRRLDLASFFVLCAQNRGFKINAFTSYEDTIEWLIADVH